MLLKNSAFSRNFIKKWLEISENEKAINDIPSKDEHPEFIDHRHDQSILSLLYAQNPDKIYKCSLRETEEYFWLHRRRGSGSDISLPKARYLKKINKFWKELRTSFYLFFR